MRKYVDDKRVLRVYEQINPALDIEGEPLFIENFEELAILITSKTMGQNVGAAEAVSSDINEYQVIVIDETGGAAGNGTPVIVNTPTPEEQQEPVSEHDGETGEELMDENEGTLGKDEGDTEGEGGAEGDEKDGKGKAAGGKDEEGKDKEGEGKGTGKDKGGAGKEGEGKESDDSKGKGKGKAGKGGKSKGEGNGTGEAGGDAGDGKGKGKGKGQGQGKKGQGEGEGEGEGEQGEGQGQSQQQGEGNEQSEAEAMSDEELQAYVFKFPSLTKTFFGRPFSQNTFINYPQEFNENVALTFTGISMAMYDTIVRKYQDFPERELMLRKRKAITIIGLLESLVSSDCLDISDDEGNPVIEKRQLLIAFNRPFMIQLIVADKICEKLLPLFFIFRKELFNRDKVLSYISFCIEFMQQENKFLCIKDWTSTTLETSDFIFVNRRVVSNLEQSAVAFRNSFDTKLRQKKFSMIPVYSIQDGRLDSVTENAEFVSDMQSFIKSLITFYFTDEEKKLERVRIDYSNLMAYAEIRVKDLMKLQLDEFISIPR